MRYQKLATFAALLLALATAGCVQTLNSGGGGAMGKNTIVLPERQIFNRQDLPADAEAVMAAMINAIRGGKKLANIGFSPEGEHGFLKEGFTYDTFDVKNIEVINYTTTEAEDGVRYSILEGGIYFADAIDRAAYVRFLAEYVVMKGEILITSSEYELLPDSYPRIVAFIVPAAAVDTLSAKDKEDFTRLYLFAYKNAVNLQPTPEERARYDEFKKLSFLSRMQYTSDRLPESYRVMIFCLERLRPESRFVVSVSGSEGVPSKSLAKPYYLNDNGWMVGIVGGKFALDAFEKPTYFHVQYCPGITKETGLAHVARFSSLKNYETPARQVNPYLKVSQGQGANEGITSGAVFLNPAVASDAKRIQQRLADLGFYSQSVDGSFGAGSKQSLQAFKTAKGLPADTAWDLATQKMLFQ